MRVAVIDLGTNTFNLLIADVFDTSFESVYNTKEGVALGMGGINEGIISFDAMERAFDTFTRFKSTCVELAVEEIVAIGTSALRDARNSNEFCQEILQRFQIAVEIVSGLEEAELIYQGISWGYDFKESSLIMDIGGGSTEFIRVEGKNQILFSSENIGVSRAYQLFEVEDKMSSEREKELRNWFEQNTSGLQDFDPCRVLVGASGSFETFYEMILERSFPVNRSHVTLEREELLAMLDWIIYSTQDQRDKHPHIIPIRKKMAPIAALETKWVIEKMDIQEVVISPYSLKEGVLRRFVRE